MVVGVGQDTGRLAGRLSHGHVEDARVVLVTHGGLGRTGGGQRGHLGGRELVGGGDRGSVLRNSGYVRVTR